MVVDEIDAREQYKGNWQLYSDEAVTAMKAGVLFMRGEYDGRSRRLRIGLQTHVDFCTSSYLGLDVDEDVIATVIKAVDAHGLGRCASPIYYAPKISEAIEMMICEIVGSERAMLFSSATMANIAAICYGIPRGYQPIADECAHRSIKEAVKLRRRKGICYYNCDIDDLRAKIDLSGKNAIITDGIFSMSGQMAPIKNIMECIDGTDNYLVVDDSHGFAIDGRRGEGSLQGIPVPLHKNIICVGSLTKAVAGAGGFVACSEEVAERIVRYSPEE